jgi:hypothetical protein
MVLNSALIQKKSRFRLLEIWVMQAGVFWMRTFISAGSCIFLGASVFEFSKRFVEGILEEG